MRPSSTLLLLAAAGCAGAPPTRVTTWGTMREVLREGHTEARVAPAAVASPHAIGVGALAALAGEVTIVDGATHIAEAQADGTLRVRAATAADQAALLVVAEVERWIELPLGACTDYDALEDRIETALREHGRDPGAPQPVRVRGAARRLALHVIAGACPIARPDGPAPWRFVGPVAAVELVGVFVDGAAGRLTHHDRRSHLHAVAPGLAGHLDDVAFDRAVLLLPDDR
ncbi:MAG: hypothetical protein JNL08_04850 [Planctomycetes bacterium]|nr:hypothetical protein [Planctomycetota bacterium]